MALQTGLDLSGVDVLGRRLDGPALGPHERERAVGLDTAEVVGVVPPAGLTHRVQLGTVEVAVHDRRSPDADLARLARRQFLAIGAEHGDAHEWGGAAARTDARL